MTEVSRIKPLLSKNNYRPSAVAKDRVDKFSSPTRPGFELRSLAWEAGTLRRGLRPRLLASVTRAPRDQGSEVLPAQHLPAGLCYTSQRDIGECFVER